MRLRVWLRAVRIRFLLSSVIAVSIGGAASWSVHARIDPLDLLLVGAGVAALHASVDLLNDYRDYKRGIDKAAPRTGMSGGSGVLPEGLLEPRSVYRAGMACLACGSAVGSYYVYLHGITIGLILGFAVLSIYFYSTRIVDWGLGEVFVGIKGGLIVCGSYYIQSGGLDGTALFAGAAAGSLSAFVLFMTSFPDHDADRGGGRRTLVIRLGVRGGRPGSTLHFPPPLPRPYWQALPWDSFRRTAWYRWPPFRWAFWQEGALSGTAPCPAPRCAAPCSSPGYLGPRWQQGLPRRL